MKDLKANTMPRKYHELKHGKRVLGSAPLDDDPFDNDFVLFWSTALSASEFLAKCEHLVHAPGNLRNVEIIADNDMIDFDDEDLFSKVESRSIVRFNALDWSVTWLDGGGSGLNEIEVCSAKLPSIMRSMVTGSVEGFTDDEVDSVLRDLQAA